MQLKANDKYPLVKQPIGVIYTTLKASNSISLFENLSSLKGYVIKFSKYFESFVLFFETWWVNNFIAANLHSQNGCMRKQDHPNLPVASKMSVNSAGALLGFPVEASMNPSVTSPSLISSIFSLQISETILNFTLGISLMMVRIVRSSSQLAGL